jgi:hypothetical protein
MIDQQCVVPVTAAPGSSLRSVVTHRRELVHWLLLAIVGSAIGMVFCDVVGGWDWLASTIATVLAVAATYTLVKPAFYPHHVGTESLPAGSAEEPGDV